MRASSAGHFSGLEDRGVVEVGRNGDLNHPEPGCPVTGRLPYGWARDVAVPLPSFP